MSTYYFLKPDVSHSQPCLLIRTPHGHNILIDGGPSPVILEKLGQEMPFWNRKVDLIILTHPHYDHVAGLIEVLKNYQVDNILWTGALTDTLAFKEWQATLKEAEPDIHIAAAGQVIYGGSVALQVFYPFGDFQDQKVSNPDNTSVVIRVVFGESSFLFTGDAFKEVEIELLEKGINVNSNVLQVGHHGSRTSTAPEFIASVLPEIAIISAGKDNRYGHPHQETLETLENYGVFILRTDLHGDIKISTSHDGKYLIKYRDYGI